MLFLYRPRETWLPFRLPRNVAQQRAYNRQLQERFDQTRVHEPATATPTAEQRDPIAALKELGKLHNSGALTDAEFATAKSKLLGTDDSSHDLER
jgi:hypothetical protein